MEKKLAEKKREAELKKQEAAAEKLVKLRTDMESRKKLTDELRKRIIAQQARAQALKSEAKSRKADAALLGKKLAEQRARANKAQRAAETAAKAKVAALRGASPESKPAVTDLRFQKTARGGEVRIELSRSVSYEIVRTGPRRLEMRLRHGFWLAGAPSTRAR